MFSFYFDLILIVFLTYILSEFFGFITNILSKEISNIFIFLNMKIIDNITILDILCFIFVIILFSLKKYVTLPHNDG
jgi:hypothetical protein